MRNDLSEDGPSAYANGPASATPTIHATHRSVLLIWADGGYAGKLVDWVSETLARVLTIVKRPRDQAGFQVLPWRWIVERTFGWLNRSRRLSKDYEALPATSEAWIRIAMIQLMLRRLARPT